MAGLNPLSNKNMKVNGNGSQPAANPLLLPQTPEGNNYSTPPFLEPRKMKNDRPRSSNLKQIS